MKINILGLDDVLVEEITKLYIDDKHFEYITDEHCIEYQIGSISMFTKDSINYFRESNVKFFKDTCGVIILFKTSNKDDIKNIWFNELLHNLEKTVPLLFLEIEDDQYKNMNSDFLKIFYKNYDKVNHSVIKKNKALIKIVLDRLIKRVSNI